MTIIGMLSNRVLVELDPPKEKEGSLFIPDTGKDAPQTATVRAVGPGRVEGGDLNPTTVEVGDRVIFGKYSGTEVEIDGKTYLSIREDDLIAILEEEEDEPSEPWLEQSAESEEAPPSRQS
jgi:chaperonin GroES